MDDFSRWDEDWSWDDIESEVIVVDWFRETTIKCFVKSNGDVYSNRQDYWAVNRTDSMHLITTYKSNYINFYQINDSIIAFDGCESYAVEEYKIWLFNKHAQELKCVGLGMFPNQDGNAFIDKKRGLIYFHQIKGTINYFDLKEKETGVVLCANDYKHFRNPKYFIGRDSLNILFFQHTSNGVIMDTIIQVER